MCLLYRNHRREGPADTEFWIKGGLGMLRDVELGMGLRQKTQWVPLKPETFCGEASPTAVVRGHTSMSLFKNSLLGLSLGRNDARKLKGTCKCLAYSIVCLNSLASSDVLIDVLIDVFILRSETKELAIYPYRVIG